MENLYFYQTVLPNLVGRKFDMPRNYGHAEYKILGGSEEWRKHRDAQKLFFHFDDAGNPVCTGNAVTQKTLCIVIKRLGGYNGSVRTTFAQLLQEVM